MTDLLFGGETRQVEYKKNYSRNLLKTVSAYANYHNGYIILGIEDNGKISGVSDAEEVRLNLENTINDSIEPRPFYEITAKNIDDKTVIVLKVYKGDYTPYLYRGKAYRRMDTATISVDSFSYKELVLEGRNLSFEQLPAKEQNLEFHLLERALKKELKISHLTDDMLVTIGLKEKNLLNNAAALMADNNPLENAVIQLVAYPGESVLHIKDRLTVKNASLLEQYEAAMAFYRKHINIGENISGPYRVTVEEIPLIAFREAVANAIVHRDYLREGDIRIEFFSDKVAITSPGCLPAGISEPEYYNGTVSVLRNRIVAEIFLRLGIIEKLATGVRRIKEYYRDYDEKPVFKVYQNSITVILPKTTLNGSGTTNTVKEANYANHLNEKERTIYQALLKKGPLTRSTLEEELNLKKTQTVSILKALREKKIVVQLGKGPNAKYTLRD